MTRRTEHFGDATLILGDCLEVMATLAAGSIDLVLTDPPYGTTACKWDAVIPLGPMWAGLQRVSKKSAAIVMTASQPFTSALVMSNPEWFRHEWVWLKNRGSNFANTVREPMKEHEVVLVFSRGGWTYNKQMQERTGSGGERVKTPIADGDYPREGYREFAGRGGAMRPKMRIPSSWQKFNTASGAEKTAHPTQKPVALMEYMIRTYTNPGETVLDFTMGSGTTGVAALNLGRKFIGIEIEPKYFDIACRRIELAAAQERMEFGERVAVEQMEIQTA